MMNLSNNMIGYFWHFHMFFGLMILVGLVFLFIWAAKNLKAKELTKWAATLLIVGLVGALLTANWGFRGMRSMMGYDDARFEKMIKYVEDSDTKKFNSNDEFRDDMLDQMKNMMDFDDKK